MNRAAAILLLVASCAGCSSYEDSNPGSNEVMTGPELSHERETRLSGDPPPPMREELKKTQIVLITNADTAAVPTTVNTGPAATNTSGTVYPVNRAP